MRSGGKEIERVIKEKQSGASEDPHFRVKTCYLGRN
jgi:hypothetical protein